MKKVYLLTIVDKSYNEHQFETVFHSVYQGKALAQHYMLKDIVEQIEKSRIKDIDELNMNNDEYINNNIIWKIEAVGFFNGII